jgi:hypothetical protein
MRREEKRRDGHIHRYTQMNLQIKKLGENESTKQENVRKECYV